MHMNQASGTKRKLGDLRFRKEKNHARALMFYRKIKYKMSKLQFTSLFSKIQTRFLKFFMLCRSNLVF